MRLRIGLSAVVLLLGTAAAYSIYMFQIEGPPVPSPHSVHLLNKPATQRGDTVSLNSARARFQSRFHLVPDQRFLRAASLVTQFPAGAASHSMKLTFADAGWSLDTDKGPMGRLPAYPDFDDAMALLRQQAAADLPQWRVITRAAPDAQLTAESFDENILLNTLIALNKDYRPGELSTGDLEASASAMARLAYLEDDEAQTADSIYATAMARIAVAEAAGGERLSKEEGLLAAAMGYSAAAAKIAQALPASDPWKIYLSRDDESLNHAARLAPDSTELSYFWLKRLAELDRKDEWQSWFNTHFNGRQACVSCYATQFAMYGHEPVIAGSHEVAMAVLASLHRVAPGQAKTEVISQVPVKVMTDFESAATRFGDTIKGPYLSADDVVVYYRGFLYTAFDKWALYLLDEWGRPADAKAYLANLADAPQGAGQEFRRWYGNKIESESWTPNAQPTIDGVKALQVLGPSLYTDVVEDFIKAQQAGSPQVRLAVDSMATAYDSRPSLRYDYAGLLFYARDLPGREDIFESLKATESDDDSYSRLAVYDFDDASQNLLKIALDGKRPPLLRRQALTYLRHYNGLAAGERKGYQLLLEEFPADGRTFEDYLDFLKKAQDYPEMQRVAKVWLLSQPEDRSIFEYWIAIDDLAESQLKQGHADDAWQTLIPSIFPGQFAAPPPSPHMHTSGYGEGLREGVKVALARKDLAMAEALAEDEAATYPESLSSQMELLSVWWTEGRDSEAAGFLAHFAHPIAEWQWRWTIGSTFADTLAQDQTHAEQAMGALAAAHLDAGTLYQLVYAVEAAGHEDVAFAVVQRLQAPGFQRVETLTSAYQVLKNQKGIPAAEAWLAPRLSPDRRVEQGMYFYYAHEPELLWDMVPMDGASTEDADQVWLWRAAAMAQGMALTMGQRQALVASVANGGDRWYPELTRYVMGQGDSEALLNRPLLVRPLSEASYYVALRALSAGKYHEGEEWLQVDLDSNDTRNGEYHWGLELLDHWAANDKSLAALASRHELFEGSDLNLDQ